MNKQIRILVFGLPGSGKTHLINQCLSDIDNALRLSGGSLINMEITDSERDKLRQLSPDQVLYNQNLLVSNYNRLCKENVNKTIIFDGHLIVKDGQSEVIIPLNIITSLKPTAIVFLDTKPEDILSRRRKDSTRPNRENDTLEKINLFREKQLDIFMNYEEKIEIPCLNLRDSPYANFKSFVEALKPN